MVVESTIMSEEACAKIALDIQDACNIGGFLVSYRNVILSIRNKYGFDVKYMESPAVILMQDKLEDLLRVPVLERCSDEKSNRYSKAYTACQELAKAYKEA